MGEKTFIGRTRQAIRECGQEAASSERECSARRFLYILPLTATTETPHSTLQSGGQPRRSRPNLAVSGWPIRRPNLADQVDVLGAVLAAAEWRRRLLPKKGLKRRVPA